MPNMTGKQRCEAAFNATVRMQHVVDLASLHASEAFEVRLDGPAEDMVDDLLGDDCKIHPSMEQLQVLVRQADEDGGTAILGDLLYHHNVLGLVVNFATPVMTKTGKDSYTYSWGYTQSMWVYAETYDAAWKLGVAWAEAERLQAEKPKKKAAKRPRKADDAEAARG